MRSTVCLLLSLACLSIAGCGGGDASKAGSAGVPDALNLGNVTRIEIKNSHDEILNTIEDGEQIQKVVAFVKNQRSGWGRPWYGIPVPQIVANFYDGDRFKGHFGVGPRFFEIQQHGDFASKEASAEQCLEFLRCIGVDKQLLEE